MRTLGIDVGGSFAKMGTVGSDTSAASLEMVALPLQREWLAQRLQPQGGEVDQVLLTGAGASQVKKWFPDQRFCVVPELEATGLGGAYLADLDRCVVVNVGSGTPVLYVDKHGNQVEHLGGTGMGSASLGGLAHFLAGVTDLQEVGRAALGGDPDKVNLLVGDIYDDPSNVGLPSTTTASNFGKYQDWRKLKPEDHPSNDDLLAGLHTMVGQVIATIATALARGRCRPDATLPIVVTGGGTLNPALVKYLRSTFGFLNQEVVFPPKGEYGTLHGLFVKHNLLMYDTTR